MTLIVRPALEGSVAVRDGRRLSFAEFGEHSGPAVLWMHGTPGARRQVPLAARSWAIEHGVRIIGVDRPGIGTSTPHVSDNVLDFVADLEILLDVLGIDEVRVIGLSGGGPYALACPVALGERVPVVAVLGGVAPTVGPDAASGGLMELANRCAPLLVHGRRPLGYLLSRFIQTARPVAGLAIDTYAAFQPEGDKRLLRDPEFREMFLDDLINGSRFQTAAPLIDLILMTQPWGFELADVTCPVLWWHGLEDHIVPARHGRHQVDRLPNATLVEVPGECHLGGLEFAVAALEGLFDERHQPAKKVRQRGSTR